MSSVSAIDRRSHSPQHSRTLERNAPTSAPPGGPGDKTCRANGDSSSPMCRSSCSSRSSGSFLSRQLDEHRICTGCALRNLLPTEERRKVWESLGNCSEVGG